LGWGFISLSRNNAKENKRIKMYKKLHESKEAANSHIAKIKARNGEVTQSVQNGKILLEYSFPDEFNVNKLIGKKVKVFYEPLSTTKENEKLPYYHYQFKGLNSTRRQVGSITKVFVGDDKQDYYKDKYSATISFENGKIGNYRLRYIEILEK
jgi:hypothetical protein